MSEPFEQKRITDMSKQEAEGASYIPVRHKPTAEEMMDASLQAQIYMLTKRVEALERHHHSYIAPRGGWANGTFEETTGPGGLKWDRED